jgi:chromosome segregation ATPase
MGIADETYKAIIDTLTNQKNAVDAALVSERASSNAMIVELREKDTELRETSRQQLGMSCIIHFYIFTLSDALRAQHDSEIKDYKMQLDDLKNQKSDIEAELKVLKKEHEYVQQMIAGLNTEKARLEDELVKSKALAEKQSLELAENTKTIQDLKTAAQVERESLQADLMKVKGQLEIIQADKARLTEE